MADGEDDDAFPKHQIGEVVFFEAGLQIDPAHLIAPGMEEELEQTPG